MSSRPMADPHRIRELRERRGLTVGDVARALARTSQTVSRWEQGVHAPAPKDVSALARLYGVPEADLLVAGDTDAEAAQDGRRSVREYFARRLRESIDQSGYTNRQIAAALHVAPQTLSNWRTGTSFPDADNQVRLCLVLGVTIADLYPPAAGSRGQLGAPTPDESELLGYYRGMDALGRGRLLALARDMAASSNYGQGARDD